MIRFLFLFPDLIDDLTLNMSHFDERRLLICIIKYGKASNLYNQIRYFPSNISNIPRQEKILGLLRNHLLRYKFNFYSWHGMNVQRIAIIINSHRHKFEIISSRFSF